TAAMLTARQTGIPVNMQEALKHAQTAIRVRPQSPKGHDAVGQVNLAMGKIDDAVAAFEKSHELDSRNPDRAIQAATAEMTDSRYESAEKRLKTLTVTYENHASVYIALARLYAKQVKFDEAWEMINKASKAQICSAREQQMIKQLMNQIQPYRSKP
ncbi:MAG: tetratricopeptide repeat protein, partial [Planctomycetota bacterium]